MIVMNMFGRNVLDKIMFDGLVSGKISNKIGITDVGTIHILFISYL